MRREVPTLPARAASHRHSHGPERVRGEPQDRDRDPQELGTFETVSQHSMRCASELPFREQESDSARARLM
jgi:hypothetical protein